MRRLVGYRRLEGSAAAAILARLVALLQTLDPLRLLEEIRQAQQQLATLADNRVAALPAVHNEDLYRFLMGLSTAWQAGDVRPTDRDRKCSVHDWRTRKDPFDTTWPTVFAWFEESPEQTVLSLRYGPLSSRLGVME